LRWLKLFFGIYLESFGSLFSGSNGFWELSSQFLGNHECVKNININFRNYPLFPLTVVLRAYLYMKGSVQNNVGPVVTFPWKQISFQAMQKCWCFVLIYTPHCPALVLFCSVSFQPPPLTNSSHTIQTAQT